MQIGGGGDREPSASTRRCWLWILGGILVFFGLVSILVREAEADAASLSSSSLRARVAAASHAASATGELVPSDTSFLLVRDEMIGVSVIVSFIAPRSSASAATATATSSAAASAALSASDPFAPENREKGLTVVGAGNFPRPRAGYSVLLNKFGTVPDHVLLVTEAFEPQGAAPLSPADLGAFYELVSQLPGVGFYNSGEAAGASQPHKHMQAVPLDVLAAIARADRDSAAPGPVFSPPMDELLSGRAQAGATGVTQLPELPFAHGFAALPDEPSSATLGAVYQALLDFVGLLPVSRGSPMAPYNLVLTKKWILVVPRSRRMHGGVDVNGMGFMGCLLARGEEARATLRETAPSAILRGVGYAPM